MNLPKFLYRGDRYKNTTLPEMHYEAGLHTKLLNSGDPDYITKYGIYKSIISHVSPTNEEEIKFYKTSHFLSFSESKERAKYYAADKKPDEMVEVSKYRERRYVFTFNFETTKVVQKSKYLYAISYKCNRKLIEPLSFDTFELIKRRKIKCELCEVNNILHILLILDVVSILRDYPNYRRNNDALISAIRDKEWLVLPYDYEPELYGYSSKIPRADFWSTEYYRLSSEKEKSIEESSFGIMI